MSVPDNRFNEILVIFPCVSYFSLVILFDPSSVINCWKAIQRRSSLCCPEGGGNACLTRLLIKTSFLILVILMHSLFVPA